MPQEGNGILNSASHGEAPVMEKLLAAYPTAPDGERSDTIQIIDDTYRRACIAHGRYMGASEEDIQDAFNKALSNLSMQMDQRNVRHETLKPFLKRIFTNCVLDIFRANNIHAKVIKYARMEAMREGQIYEDEHDFGEGKAAPRITPSSQGEMGEARYKADYLMLRMEAALKLLRPQTRLAFMHILKGRFADIPRESHGSQSETGVIKIYQTLADETGEKNGTFRNRFSRALAELQERDPDLFQDIIDAPDEVRKLFTATLRTMPLPPMSSVRARISTARGVQASL